MTSHMREKPGPFPTAGRSGKCPSHFGRPPPIPQMVTPRVTVEGGGEVRSEMSPPQSPVKLTGSRGAELISGFIQGRVQSCRHRGRGLWRGGPWGETPEGIFLSSLLPRCLEY